MWWLYLSKPAKLSLQIHRHSLALLVVALNTKLSLLQAPFWQQSGVGPPAQHGLAWLIWQMLHVGPLSIRMSPTMMIHNFWLNWYNINQFDYILYNAFNFICSPSNPGWQSHFQIFVATELFSGLISGLHIPLFSHFKSHSSSHLVPSNPSLQLQLNSWVPLESKQLSVLSFLILISLISYQSQ